MDLSTLKYADGARKSRKKIGRGGARGGTSGRGHKGQRSRSGSKKHLWFEGGQMPIMRRLPKRGFTNFNKKKVQIVHLGDLNKLEGAEINPAILFENGLINKLDIPVKILGDGQVDRKLEISANAFSRSAVEKIEAVGGRATTL